MHNQDYIAIICDYFNKIRIESFHVTFEGNGDDGGIDNIERFEPNNLEKDAEIILKQKISGMKTPEGQIWDAKEEKSIPKWKIDPTVKELINHVCYYILEDKYSGWENNDGAFGKFIFNVKKKTVKLEFNERFTDSKLHKHIFKG